MWSKWQTRTQRSRSGTMLILQECGAYVVKHYWQSQRQQYIVEEHCKRATTDWNNEEKEWVKKIEKRGSQVKEKKKVICVVKTQTQEQCCYDFTLPVDSYVNWPQHINLEVINIILVSNSRHVNSNSVANGFKFVKWFPFVCVHRPSQSQKFMYVIKYPNISH